MAARITLAGLIYFALAFAAGFVFGAFREGLLTHWLTPPQALLVETPVMLVASTIAAWWTVCRVDVPETLVARIGMGLLALVVLVLVEEAATRLFRGTTLWALWTGWGPLAVALNLVLLAAFALLPTVVGRGGA